MSGVSEKDMSRSHRYWGFGGARPTGWYDNEYLYAGSSRGLATIMFFVGREILNFVVVDRFWEFTWGLVRGPFRLGRELWGAVLGFIS